MPGRLQRPHDRATTIQTNVIHSAWQHGVRKLLFLGSSCIYPKLAPQPMPESCLLTGPLEPTNEWYAVAKIAGIKMCQAYRRQYGFDAISLMPTNLYGPDELGRIRVVGVDPAHLRRRQKDILRSFLLKEGMDGRLARQVQLCMRSEQ